MDSTLFIVQRGEVQIVVLDQLSENGELHATELAVRSLGQHFGGGALQQPNRTSETSALALTSCTCIMLQLEPLTQVCVVLAPAVCGCHCHI